MSQSSGSPLQDPSIKSHDADVQRELEAALAGHDLVQMMQQPPAAETPPVASTKDQPAGEPAPRDLKRGRIGAIRGDDVFVDLVGLDGKSQGIVPLTQFERPPRVGSIMDFVVNGFDEAHGLWMLSREGAVGRATWEQLQRGSIVEARVTSWNKGGLDMEMIGGILAFMPASQIDFHHIDDLESLVGQKLVAVVQEIDRRSRRVVLSRRQYLQQQREAQRKKVWETLQVGQLRDGTVKSITDFGAFVDLGGVDGLLHISDMAYGHLDKPDQVVSIGQKIQVKVLKLDAEKQRISLGLKQVAPDPWSTVGERVKVGEQISGRVVRLAPFGAFVEVEPGVDGLVPLTELSWKRVSHPAQVVKEGDVVRVVVLSVDPERRRVSLSLKQASPDPWQTAKQKYPKDAWVQATVRSVTDFGAFAELEPGLEGLVHISEMADHRINAVTDVMQVGQTHKCRVLEVDSENRRIRLSLRQPATPKQHAAPAAPAVPAGAAALKFAAPPKPRKTPVRPLKGGLE